MPSVTSDRHFNILALGHSEKYSNNSNVQVGEADFVLSPIAFGKRQYVGY